jgi:hypothetical protein
MVWYAPAVTSTQDRPGGSAGTMHWPLSFAPHATAVPLLRRAIV